MDTFRRDLVYALRKFGSAPAFTATAVLTLALGIGGTTAIFTLIHAVMLQSLPVADPARLYRIGDGDDCCVQGGPAGSLGHVLLSRCSSGCRADVAGVRGAHRLPGRRARMSVRRQGVTDAPRPLRAEYVTGNYFSTLGVGAFAGRVFTADGRRAGGVRRWWCWPITPGRAPTAATPGSSAPRSSSRASPFTVAGVDAAGLLRRDAARRSAGPVDAAAAGAAHRRGRDLAPAAADSGVAARDRPPAARAPRPTAWSARLTGLLRQWMQHDAGYPANWMADDRARAAAAGDRGRAGRRRRRRDEGAVRPQPADPAGGVRPRAADRLRQRGQPAAGARGGPARSDRRPAGHGRLAAPDRHRGARRKRAARAGRRRWPGCSCRWPRSRLLLSLAFAGATLPADRHHAVAAGAGLRLRARAADRPRVRRRAGVVRHAHRSDRGAARRPAAPPAIARRWRARRCWWCRRRSRWCSWPARRCSAAAWATSSARTSASTVDGRVLVSREPAIGRRSPASG